MEPFLTSPSGPLGVGVRSGTAEPRGPKGRSLLTSPADDHQGRTKAARPVRTLFEGCADTVHVVGVATCAATSWSELDQMEAGQATLRSRARGAVDARGAQ
jgi:hypothetical protein